MKKVPENIKKMLLSNNDEDIILGLNLLLKYRDNVNEFCNYLHDIAYKETTDYRLRSITIWNIWYEENSI